ncbi:hypothetical protein L3Q82_016007 [Scortum barcoo]|uniref:Uncharacterized protein n=1 Tax=Scortum barcoo TaxID=214431 RepID=A0ACB8VQ42_9TELE|nr:hypothetical protein L3Q82_016007 [Scortum barcoo]
MELPPRPTLFDFHGVPMIEIFTANWDSIQNFKARPDDILIATYPKAGTTWVSYILDLLYFGQTCPDRHMSIPIHERVPFLEISIPSQPSGKDLADHLPTAPRLIKTHLPVQFVPKSFWEQNCRIVYVGRNAKDNTVSFFHFARMSNFQPEPGDWSTFLQRFMEGNSERNKLIQNSTTCSTEDLIEDFGREFNSLCFFLGLSPSAEEKERVATGVMFDNMKQNKMTNYSTVKTMNQDVSPFMRKDPLNFT